MDWSPTPPLDTSSILHHSTHTLVYHLPHPPSAGRCVVKTPAKPRPDPVEMARYRQEFECLKRVQGPGIPRPLGLFEPNTHPRLVYTFQPGQSLDQRLTRGPFEVEEALSVSIGVAEILAHLHRTHMIHASLCPAHVGWNPETSTTFLLDFRYSIPVPGACRDPGPLPDVVLDYVSPEMTGQLEVPLDHRTDLYSLGALLWHLLVGKPPFVSQDILGILHAHLTRPPFPPHHLRGDIPPALSEVVLRLMAKRPSDRYQSAEELLEDLKPLRAELHPGRTCTFTPGRGDPGRPLLITRAPVGRQNERRQLREALARTRAGAVEMVLLSGPPGIGKSTLALELKTLVEQQQGYFVTSRVGETALVPYQPILDCLQQLIGILVNSPLEEITPLREDLSRALGEGATYLTGFLPELALLLRSPRHTSEVPGETPHLHILVAALLRAWPRPPGGLVLFLDDLEEIPPGLVTLLEFITSDPDLRGLLLLGGVREHEGSPPAPVRDLQGTLHRQGVAITRLVIPPLDLEATTNLITLSCEGTPEDHQSAARTLLLKTGGSPLYVCAILLRSVGEGILFMQGIRWCWDLAALSRLEIPPDMAEIVPGDLEHLPDGCLTLLKVASVAGRSFSAFHVARLVGRKVTEVAEGLRPALARGVILLTSDPRDDTPTYQFAHHHLHGSLYQLAGPAFCWPLHLRSLELLDKLAQFGRADTVLERVHHLRMCREHLSPRQCLEWAPLTLRAALLARASAAPDQALALFEMGLHLLESDPSHPSHLPLLLGAAESALASGQLSRMEHYCDRVIQTTPDLVLSLPAWVTRLRARMAAGRLQETLEVADLFLNRAGRPQPQPTSPLGLALVFLHTRLLIGLRQPKDLLDLPRATDPLAAAAQLIQVLVAPAQVAILPGILPLAILRDVRSVLNEGVTPHGAQCWTGYALLLLHTFGQVELANRYGDLALAQVERLHHPQVRPSIFFIIYALLRPWSTPVGELVGPLRDNYRQGLEVGDVGYGLLSAHMADAYTYIAGANLDTLWPHVQQTQVTLRRHQHPSIEALHLSLHQGMTILRADQPPPAPLSLPAPTPVAHPWSRLATATMTLQLALIFGDLKRALVLAREHHPPLDTPTRPATFFSFWTYRAVTLLLGVERQWVNRQEVRDPVRQSCRVLKTWATRVPARRYTLEWIEATDLRSRGQFTRAMEHYQRAISAATEGGYQHDVALMADQAAQLLEQQGDLEGARRYRRQAWEHYSRWGARSRAHQLEVEFPELAPPRMPPESHSLDHLAMVKVSQALSEEVDAARLLHRLMGTLLEISGATRVVLIQQEGSLAKVTARQEGEGDTPPWGGPTPLEEATDLPVHLIRMGLRTGEMVHLEDTSRGSHDPWFSLLPPRSVVCLPLVRGGESRGLLYLENQLTPGCFGPGRLETLRLLASPAAMALENAALHEQWEARLQQRTRELEQARERAEVASQAKGDFLSHMSHELRTPLNAILGTTQLLEAKPTVDPEIREGLATVLRSGRHLLGLINHVLDMSRIESGRLELNPVPCDIHQLIRGVVTEMEGLAAPRGLTLRAECPQTIPMVEVDEQRLRQVLINLVGNAIKFTRHGQVKVRVEVGETGNTCIDLHFEIQDTGVGIPPDRLEAIFLPFEQGGARSFSAGTGLGLTISAQLVKLLGGQISVTSQVGVGSTFTVKLTTLRVQGVGMGMGEGGLTTDPPPEEVVPPRHRLVALYHLARLGNMRQFREELKSLELEGEVYHPLVKRLDHLAQDFDDGMIQFILEGLPGSPLNSPDDLAPGTTSDSRRDLD